MNLVSTYTCFPDLNLYRKIVTPSPDSDFTSFSCCKFGPFEVGEHLSVCLYVCLSHTTPSLFFSSSFFLFFFFGVCVCVWYRSVGPLKSFLISTAASGKHCLQLKLSRLSAFKTGSCGRSTCRRRTVLPRRQELQTHPSSCFSMAQAIIHQRRCIHCTSSSCLPCCFSSFNHPLSFIHLKKKKKCRCAQSFGHASHDKDMLNSNHNTSIHKSHVKTMQNSKHNSSIHTSDVSK